MGTKPSKYILPPQGVEQKTSLDLIQLTLSEKAYAKLKRKRDKALVVGVLETEETDYVPATITFKHVDYNAVIRLKGDWTDHLNGDKWSFRVKLKDDKTIMGMRKFSIHHPGTRGFINEWLYHKAVKSEGLIGLRYGFLEGMIHIKKDNSNKFINKKVGIYAIEESFDKRTIESNARKESVILKFSENAFWGNVKHTLKVGSPNGIPWSTFMNYKVDYPISVFGEEKVLADSTMLSYFKLSKNLLEDARNNDAPLSTAFDIKKLAKLNAILNLFGATHGLYTMNLRFYYNPITSKLEPIAFDGNSGLKLKKYEHLFFTSQTKDSIYLKELAYALKEVSNPKYLQRIINDNKIELAGFSKELKQEYKYQIFHENNFTYNQGVIKKELLRLKQKYNLKDLNLDTETNNYQVSKKYHIPGLSAWKETEISLTKTSLNHDGNSVYKIERTSKKKGAYIFIYGISASYGKTHQLSFMVKKADAGGFFGLRIQAIYPNRVDAIFDLNKGEVKGVEKVGNFNDELAIIEPKPNGWYKIILRTKINYDSVKLVFGPTDNEKGALGWESATTDKTNAYIDIDSIKFEELE
ncbi:hypothetical protein N8273_00655 [Algibacter sp.]|nr:hypothetical protein [Algibacter sp.]